MARLQGRCWAVALYMLLGGILLMSEQICSATLQLPPVSDESQPSLGKIVARMVAYRQWQDDALREYQAQRRFYAWNERFNIDSTLEVRTIFRWPYSLQSTVLRQEGSTFIREHVFEKILAAETELASKDEADIIPKNYDFVLLGKDGCGGERCWHLSMKPKRNDKYLLNGEIWLDATDYGICRIHGSPSKRVSLWVSKVDIDKRLRRINGIWLADRIESSSDIRFAGNVRMRIEYTYDSVTVGRPTAAAGD
jgi:hypothetical protein